MFIKLLRVFTILALSAPVAAQQNLQDLTSILPNSGFVDSTQYGNRIRGFNIVDDVASINYQINLQTRSRVVLTAQLYANSSPGTYQAPGEIQLEIPGFVFESGGQMLAETEEDRYSDFTIAGTISAGTAIFTFSNSQNLGNRWGVRNVQVAVENLPDLPTTDPVIPPPVEQLTPFASIVKVQNDCGMRFEDFLDFYPELPLSINEYADVLMARSGGYPNNIERKKFEDYIQYAERFQPRRFLREQVGEFSRTSNALMNLPGDTARSSSDDKYYWCPASCPIGYEQISIECDVEFADTSVSQLINARPGFDSQSVCAYEFNDRSPISRTDKLKINTELTCAREIQTYQYRDVQGTTDWPSNY